MAAQPRDWRGVVAVQYGTVTIADAEGAARGLADPVSFHRVIEERCGSLGEGAQIFLPERDDDVPAHIRILDELGELEPEWDHAAEVGFRVPTGRLIVFSWMHDEDVVGELTVPTEPLLARIQWGGLEAWLTDSSYRSTRGPSPLRLRIDLVPGELDGVRTLRTWHLWEPPIHESTSPTGLRRYRGWVAAERQASLVPTGTRLWPPYPTTEEGEVTSILQDPTDGSQWASGQGNTMGQPFLQELAPDEVATLESQGFPPVQSFVRDADGRIWAAFDLPLERATALRHLQSGQWTAMQQIYPPEQVVVVDLPAGWSRITRRNADGTGPAVLVDAVPGDGTDGVYVRWRDGADLSV